jgi:hypothetical protein
MKRLVIATIVLLMIVALTVIGCTNKSLVGPGPKAEGEVVSTCVTCHTDKDTLKELAVEPEVAISEETTGEG